MADEQPNQATQQQLMLQKIYVKDLSFESPKAPTIFTTNVQPQTQVNIRSGSARRRAEHAGSHVDADHRGQGQGRHAVPRRGRAVGHLLHPGLYAGRAGRAARQLLPRHAVSVRARSDRRPRHTGGFPQLLLQPINFDSLYSTGPARTHGARRAALQPQPRRPEPAGRISPTSRIAVLGAGSWGTALAIQFARAGHPAVLWGHDPAQIATISTRAATHATCRTSRFHLCSQVTADLKRP